MESIISDLQIVLLIIFNAGIALRVTMIIMAGMHDDDKNVSKLVKKYVIVLIIGNCLSGLVGVIKNYYL